MSKFMDETSLAYLWKKISQTFVKQSDVNRYATKTELNQKVNSSSLAQVATSGKYADLIGTPEFSEVATSGSYIDLTDTPDLNDLGGVDSSYVQDEIEDAKEETINNIKGLNEDEEQVTNEDLIIEDTVQTGPDTFEVTETRDYTSLYNIKNVVEQLNISNKDKTEFYTIDISEDERYSNFGEQDMIIIPFDENEYNLMSDIMENKDKLIILKKDNKTWTITNFINDELNGYESVLINALDMQIDDINNINDYLYYINNQYYLLFDGSSLNTYCFANLPIKNLKLYSPILSGEPISSTPSIEDNSTKIATTSYVQNNLSKYISIPTLPTINGSYVLTYVKNSSGGQYRWESKG